MKNMFRLVKKNMKLLIRSKASALIVILGPLIVIFLAGMAFDNSQAYSISLGAFSTSYNSITEGFIADLEKNQFKVTKYGQEDECISAIKEGTIHSCIVLSPDFTMGKDMKNEMTFYVDFSKVNLVYMVLDAISEKVGQKSEELSMNLTTVLLDTIDFTVKEVNVEKGTITTLSSKNDEIIRKIDDSYSKLSSMDTSTGAVTAALDNLTLRKNQVSSTVNNLHTVAEDILDEANSLISSVTSAVQSSSLTPEEKAYIYSLMNDSGEELEELEEELTESKNDTSTKIASLTGAITSISGSIEEAKGKLEDAAKTKDKSLENLDFAKKVINEALSSLTQLQNSLNSIENSINSIQVTDPSSIVSPVKTTIKPVVAETTHLNYIFPVLMVLVMMFTGILLSTTMVMLEKKTTAYFRNFISPTKDITFITSTFLTCFILLFVQAAVIVGISAVFFGPRIFDTLYKSAPILLLCITLFTLAGMIIGYLFNSEETATLGAISAGSALLLLSDVILPMESMPQYIFQIAQYNPFIMGSSLLRKAIIHNVPFTSIEPGLISLLAYCIALFGAVVAVQSITKKHYVAKYLRKIAAKPEHYKKANK